jgi:hypothetical protein
MVIGTDHGTFDGISWRIMRIGALLGIFHGYVVGDIHNNVIMMALS